MYAIHWVVRLKISSTHKHLQHKQYHWCACVIVVIILVSSLCFVVAILQLLEQKKKNEQSPSGEEKIKSEGGNTIIQISPVAKDRHSHQPKFWKIEVRLSLRL